MNQVKASHRWASQHAENSRTTIDSGRITDLKCSVSVFYQASERIYDLPDDLSSLDCDIWAGKARKN